MNELQRGHSEEEFDLRDGKMTLLIMVVVPVILSLALVATAIVFGRPLDSAQVLADGPELTSVYWSGDSTDAVVKDEHNANVVEPVRLSPEVPGSDDGYDLSELLTSPERALVLGLYGSYSLW